MGKLLFLLPPWGRDRGPGPFREPGTPQHLPEVVWLPLPLVLRIRRAPHFWNPFQDPGPLVL